MHRHARIHEIGHSVSLKITRFAARTKDSKYFGFEKGCHLALTRLPKQQKKNFALETSTENIEKDVK